MPTYETTKFLSLPQQVNKNKKDIETLQQNQADISNLIPNTEKGQPLGVATLDATGKVPPAQMPANPGNFLEKTGGTMEGSINMDGYDITVAGSVETGSVFTNDIDSLSGEIQVEVPLRMNNNKITGADKGTANGDVATVDNINDHNTSPFAHADIRNLISAIQGAYIYRGVINENTVDVTQINLNARILVLMGRAAILGDVLTDLDRTDWYFDGTSWDNMGQTFVVLASAVNDGLMSKEDYTKLFDLYTKAQLDATFEVLANKAIDFSVLNDTKYPTTKAVSERTFDKELLTFTLPNRVTDYIKFENGKYYYVKRVQRYVVQANDILDVASGTHATRARIALTTFVGIVAQSAIIIDYNTYVTNKYEINVSPVDVVGGENTYRTTGTNMEIGVTLGLTLEQARTALAGKAIYYQLATPIETEINDIKTANWLYNLFNSEAWITPTLVNSWTNVSGYTANYMKDNVGRVYVRGRISSGSLGTVVFTLPAGYRPSQTSFFAITSNDAFGTCYVNTDGQLIVSVGATTNVSINISFRGEL